MNRPGSGMHRLLPAHNLPAAGRPFRVSASADECRHLAERFDLIAVDSLTAEGALFPEADGQRVRLEGRLIADVVQTCVVSLDPVPAHIDVPFERLYGWDAGGEPAKEADEVFLDLDDEVPVERLAGDTIDVGEATAEQLALELDPYPRKPGALFTGCDIGGGGESEDQALGSLAGLGRRWKRGGSGGDG